MADDAFPSITPPTVLGVKDIAYTICDPDPDGEENQVMIYEAQIVWSDGTITIKQGSVVPHLTTLELGGLDNLVARLRGKAEVVWGDYTDGD